MIRRPAVQRAKRGAPTGDTKTLPAPIGGWNTRDSEANMPQNKALILENWIPRAAYLESRDGAIDWATGFPSSVRSIFQHAGVSSSKLFAACDSGIYNITSSGAVGAAVKACTNGRFSSAMFDNAAGHWLTLVNGVDDLIQYDGTTWRSINAGTVPALTGVSGTSLNFVHSFKKRLWFVQKDSTSAWYLPTAAIAGAAVEFPLGQIFGRGGHLVSIGTWSIDGGQGLDDHIVFASSEGELAVYKGVNPDTDFELIGVYFLGEPLGNRCFAKLGGDLLYLSQNGLFPLSKALLSTSINYRSALSDEIAPTFASYAALYKGFEGWEIFVLPQESVLLVNAPQGAAASYVEQLVMSTTNQAWSKFIGWNAQCWAVFGQEGFFGHGNSVAKAFTGSSDFGANIVLNAKSAYNYFGNTAQEKHFSLVRPIYRADAPVNLQLALSMDFNLDITFGVPTTPPFAGALFDSAVFDSAVWGGGLETYKQWYTVIAPAGYCAAVYLRVLTKTAKVMWVATDFLFNKGGVL